MVNQRSGIPSKEISLRRRYASNSVALSPNITNPAITANSGNINSFNTTNNYYGGANSSPNHVEILQCLYTSKYEEHRDRVRQPVEGTCTWVTKHRKYKNWLARETSGVLWLSADPGCGKSVIASFLVGHLENRTDAIVCYFFFKDDSEEQRSATFALCAILHQIFKRRTHLLGFAEEEYKAKGKGFTEEVNTLWNILVKVVAEGQCGEVFCVVDALDECGEGTLDQLISCVCGLSRSVTPAIPLKFLVTGRPYHRIERQLGAPATTIRLKGEVEVSAITTDVNRVIDKGIKDLESYWRQPGKLKYLRNLLKSSADRTFLWVSLVLEVLRDSEYSSVEEFTNIVSTAPRDLTEFYTKILDKSRYPEKARRILHIVVAAKRSLTLQEMHAAFRIKREHKSVKEIRNLPAGFDKSVKNWCGLFVRVIDSKIYLVHQTAREFLIKGSLCGLGNWQYTLCPKDSNFLLADICVSYILLEEFENDPLAINPSYWSRSDEEYVGYLQKYSLLDYAAIHWVDHFRDSQSRQMELFESTRLICELRSKRFLVWLKVHWANNNPYYPFPADFTHLMMASWLGQGAVVQQLLREGVDIDARSGEYDTALSIAEFRNEKEITRMLMQRNTKAYWDRKYNILDTKIEIGQLSAIVGVVSSAAARVAGSVSDCVGIAFPSAIITAWIVFVILKLFFFLDLLFVPMTFKNHLDLCMNLLNLGEYYIFMSGCVFFVAEFVGSLFT